MILSLYVSMVRSFEGRQRLLSAESQGSADGLSVQYHCADMMTWLENHADTYDCIVTVATPYHVDLAAALRLSDGVTITHQQMPGARVSIGPRLALLRRGPSLRSRRT